MSMIKKLYHGSSSIIEKPLFGYGKPYNDYGLGFYCTDSLDMAKKWGVGKDHDGYANCYEIECDGLRILELKVPEYCILHWLISVDYESCDAIIGYRADNNYFLFAQDFINGTILDRQLNNAMHLGKPGQQFVLKSKTAFERIKSIGSEIAESSEWYEKNAVRQDRPPRNALKPETNLKLPRQKNINKAQAEYLVVLAKVLCCEAEDLMEKME